MAQGPSDTILVAIRITLQIRESKVRNPDPPDRRRFVLSECSLVVYAFDGNIQECAGSLSRICPMAPTVQERAYHVGTCDNLSTCVFVVLFVVQQIE